MKLNTRNGNFEFENWIFTRTYKLTDIESKLPLEGLELWSSNLSWQSFRLTMDQGHILVVIVQRWYYKSYYNISNRKTGK